MNPYRSNSIVRGRMCLLLISPAMAMALVVLGAAPAEVYAQPSPAATRPTTGPAATPASRVLDIAGVKADMSSEQLVELAQRIGQEGRYQDAERILTEVIRSEPRNLRAYQAVAQLYEIQAAALRADTNDPEAARAKADTLVAQAVKTYVQYAAPLAIEQGNSETAEQIYKLVLQHERHRYNPEALLGMARLLDAKNSLQAIDRYKTYLNPRFCPTGAKDAQAHLELGKIYFNRRYLNQAVSILENARALDPMNSEILLQLARTYLESGMRAKAMDMVRQAVNNAPGNPSYRDVYAQVLIAQATSLQGTGAPEIVRQTLEQARTESGEAIRGAEAAVNASPGDTKALAVLQSCYATRQQVLSRLLQIAENDVKLVVELADYGRRQAELRRKLALHGVLAGLLTVSEAGANNIAWLEQVATLQYELQLLPAAGETCKRLQSLDAGNAVAKQILSRMGSATSLPSDAPVPAPAPAGSRN